MLEETAGHWNSDMQRYPHAFKCEGRILLLQDGNEFSRNGAKLTVLET